MESLTKRVTALAVCICSLVLATDALAQVIEDDWEFAEDATRKLTVAAVRYDSGNAIIVQCTGEELKVVLIGLPATTATIRTLDATRSNGATDLQAWQVSEGQTLVSRVPARDARFLRSGGDLSLRSTAGQAAPVTASFDLPTQHANLDRVIAACGYVVEDDRDSVLRADPNLRLARAPAEYTTGGQAGRSLEVSCLIQGGAYQQCRAHHRLQGQSEASARREAARLNGTRLHRDDAAANEGRVAYINVPMLTVVRLEEIG